MVFRVNLDIEVESVSSDAIEWGKLSFFNCPEDK
jgi:hypothetical protein